MHRLSRMLRMMLLPVTIMLVPHSSSAGSFRLRLPLATLMALAALPVLGVSYIYTMVHDALRYEPTRQELVYYKGRFAELESTISALDEANREFRSLFDLGSQEEVLENIHRTDMGDLDMAYLRKQVDRSIESVGEIRDYLSEARDLYLATPLGWPVMGWTSSGYGYRIHPISGTRKFHSGMDISTRKGTPVRATADGVVSFSGRSGANGNLVVLEHGFGYRTYFAHNTRNAVKVGQVVKRGDIISYVGSTGNSTGPHLHYEIWKNGKDTNPMPFIKGANWQMLAAGQ